MFEDTSSTPEPEGSLSEEDASVINTEGIVAGTVRDLTKELRVRDATHGTRFHACVHFPSPNGRQRGKSLVTVDLSALESPKLLNPTPNFVAKLLDNLLGVVCLDLEASTTHVTDIMVSQSIQPH